MCGKCDQRWLMLTHAALVDLTEQPQTAATSKQQQTIIITILVVVTFFDSLRLIPSSLYYPYSVLVMQNMVTWGQNQNNPPPTSHNNSMYQAPAPSAGGFGAFSFGTSPSTTAAPVSFGAPVDGGLVFGQINTTSAPPTHPAPQYAQPFGSSAAPVPTGGFGSSIPASGFAFGQFGSSASASRGSITTTGGFFGSSRDPSGFYSGSSPAPASAAGGFGSAGLFGSSLAPDAFGHARDGTRRRRMVVEGPTRADVLNDKPPPVCVICRTNTPVCIAMPCHHLAYCAGCAHTLCTDARGHPKAIGQVRCAKCRQTVDSIKPYFSE